MNIPILFQIVVSSDNKLITDSAKPREEFFRTFSEFAEGADLVFFDPDNGIEIKSVPFGKKSSSKYLYWDEVKESYLAGHSLLIYQHFPRCARDPFIKSLVRKFRDLLGAKKVFSYCTHHVVFLLIPQPDHVEMFLENNHKIKKTWGEMIKIGKHEVINA